MIVENKISVVINTYNEENSLAEILEYVKDFDEILVCDMESTDKTVSIAESFGCRVVTFPKGDCNIVEPARDFAIHSAKYPWVLVVDADEIIPAKLKDYLYNYIQSENPADGLLIARKNYVMNRFFKNSYPDYQLRFFRQDKTKWPEFIHARPVVDGRTERIPSAQMDLAMTHKSMTLFTKLAKMNVYTTNEIVKRPNEKVNLMRICFKSFFCFVKSYLFKGGIFQGISGLVHAVNEANYKFYTLVKIWEHRNAEKKS